jgi:hypothetical protein
MWFDAERENAKVEAKWNEIVRDVMVVLEFV